MSGDFFIRSVFAFKTLNFEGLLVFILCIFSLNGNMFLHFGCLLAFLAKFKHNFSRRFSNVSSSSMSNAFWYDLYLKPRIILSTVFCTLSRSSLFSTVIELCNCARPNKSCCGGECLGSDICFRCNGRQKTDFDIFSRPTVSHTWVLALNSTTFNFNC